MVSKNDDFINRWRAEAALTQTHLVLATDDELRSRRCWRYVAALGSTLNPYLVGLVIAFALIRFRITQNAFLVFYAMGYAFCFSLYNWSHAHRMKTKMLMRRQLLLADLPGRSEDSLRSALGRTMPYVLLLRDFQSAQDPNNSLGSEASYRPIIKSFGDEIEKALPGLIPGGLMIVTLHNSRDCSGGIDDDRYRYILCSDKSFEPTVAELTNFAEAIFVVQRGRSVSAGLLREFNILFSLKVLSKTVIISNNTFQLNDMGGGVAAHISQYDLCRSIEHKDVRIAMSGRISDFILSRRERISGLVRYTTNEQESAN